jgi:succinate dehydrogenase / fumarate reductase cytochrome b subunit
MLGGLRHFVWDLGHGFDPAVSTRMAKATLIGSICLTALVWIIGIVIRLG